MFKPILMLLLLFIISCADKPPKGDTNETGAHATIHTKDTTLQLNNGEKWKLDEATRQNMNEIKAYISQATHANGELSGQELQKKADKLVKECRMKGADHDALHVWLGPFLQHVQAIKENRDAESASHALRDDVKEFDVYFE